LAPRAATIAGQAHFLRADFPSAQRAFAQAKRLAQDDRDETDALHGLASSSIFGEHPDAGEVVEVLRQRRRQSPVDFIRYATGDVAYRQLGGAGLGDDLDLHVIRQALPHADDPRARSAAAYTVAYSQTTVADYRTANEWLGIFFDEATRFNLDFAMPLANYVVGRIALGERRYGDAERALQAIEDHAARTKDERHRINATALRARLVLQNGDPEAALWCVTPTPTVTLIPSWYGEYIATRALALAVLGHRDEAVRQADHAAASTACYEVHSLSLVAKAVAEPSCSEARRRSVEFATRLNAWDPVLCGARSSTPFALGLSDDDATRGNVETLYARTGDVFLARRSGIRIRATSRPDQVLTRRELEVLGLIARGFKNSEISRALYISESTTKVHVRHILEKLGVRTRAEAVARYENFRREAD
jgi:DNA-binding CsgD family transcriptional regulator